MKKFAKIAQLKWEKGKRIISNTISTTYFVVEKEEWMPKSL